jgi:hypothetical protein
VHFERDFGDVQCLRDHSVRQTSRSRPGETCQEFRRVADWYVRDETCRQGLASIINAQHRDPFAHLPPAIGPAQDGEVGRKHPAANAHGPAIDIRSGAGDAPSETAGLQRLPRHGVRQVPRIPRTGRGRPWAPSLSVVIHGVPMPSAAKRLTSRRCRSDHRAHADRRAIIRWPRHALRWWSGSSTRHSASSCATWIAEYVPQGGRPILRSPRYGITVTLPLMPRPPGPPCTSQ